MPKHVFQDPQGNITVVDDRTLQQAKDERIAYLNACADQALQALLPILQLARWLTGDMNNSQKNALIAQMQPIISNLSTKTAAVNACTTNDQCDAIQW